MDVHDRYCQVAILDDDTDNPEECRIRAERADCDAVRSLSGDSSGSRRASADHPAEEAFRTHQIYTLYVTVAEQAGADPLSEDRVYRLLKEQSFLRMTESNHTGGGQGEGSYLEHRLLRDPEVVI